MSLVVGCSDRSPSPPRHATEEPHPNIVLLSIDTWRADFFSEQSMPLTFRWATRSIDPLLRISTNSTWTRPSHVTMLTVLLPREHGVEYQDSVMSPDIPTVPALLRELDYFSCASTGSGHVSDYVGLAKDFEEWVQVDNVPGPTYFSTLLQPIEQARELLSAPRGRPTFAFVHTYYVHEYYLDETDFADRSFESLREWNAYRIEKAHRLQSPEFADQMRARYAAKVTEFDAILVDFLEWLQGSRLGDNLCIIVTSDHGEGLHERHGAQRTYGHMGPPNPEKVQIPLFVSGLGTGEDHHLISLRDLPEMIVHLATDGELWLPDNQVIEAEFLTDDRDAVEKIRHTSMVYADGTWVHTRSPGHSIDDTREAPDLPQEHLDQLRALGYVPE